MLLLFSNRFCCEAGKVGKEGVVGISESLNIIARAVPTEYARDSAAASPTHVKLQGYLVC